MSSNVFFIDDGFSRKMSKAFISFVEENITNNSKDITIVVDSVGGDSVDATLMSHWLRKRRGSFTAINVVVLGNCMSAAFDFVVSVKDIAAIKTTRTALYMLHKIFLKDLPADSKAHKEAKRIQKADLEASLKAYGKVLTSSQVLALKKGLDVYLSIEQAVSLLNAERI